MTNFRGQVQMKASNSLALLVDGSFSHSVRTATWPAIVVARSGQTHRVAAVQQPPNLYLAGRWHELIASSKEGARTVHLTAIDLKRSPTEIDR